MRVVAVGVAQASNDKEQVEPMLAKLKAQTEVLGAVDGLIADTGFCSEKNIPAAAGIEPLIAVARDEHPPDWRERHSEPAALLENATPVQAMSHCLKTQAGRALDALRKQTVEPIFGGAQLVQGKSVGAPPRCRQTAGSSLAVTSSSFRRSKSVCSASWVAAGQ